MIKEMVESTERQDEADAKLSELSRHFVQSAAKNATEIEMLQAGEEAAVRRAEALEEALADHSNETREAVDALHRRIDALEADMIKRFASAATRVDESSRGRVRVIVCV